MYDSQYTPEEYESHRGWGHSTWETGIRLVEEAKAEQLILVHHDPERDDPAIDRLLREAGRRFASIIAAREGQGILLA